MFLLSFSQNDTPSPLRVSPLIPPFSSITPFYYPTTTTATTTTTSSTTATTTTHPSTYAQHSDFCGSQRVKQKRLAAIVVCPLCSLFCPHYHDHHHHVQHILEKRDEPIYQNSSHLHLVSRIVSKINLILRLLL